MMCPLPLPPLPRIRRCPPQLPVMIAPCRPSPKWLAALRSAAVGLFLLLAPIFTSAQTTVLFLRNGDRLAGKIDSEDTNHVVITTPWAKGLSVPAAEIVRREILAPKFSTNAAPEAVLANLARLGSPIPRRATNAAPKHWKAELRLGADYIYGAEDQQIYYGRFKLSYERPYNRDTNQFFRNYLDSSVDYGWSKTPGSGTNGATSVISANRMNGSDKTDTDIG